MYYYNVDTKEYIKSDVVPEGNWVLLPEKPNTLCSLGSDLTWQPPLPVLEDLYDWDEIYLIWIKR